ncbi:unnamed protein product [Amoebophrya sp. A120]|nr:unnamed protein product [Amoebophrya sp. A120]|eukprot:GSA120T00017803001.1
MASLQERTAPAAERLIQSLLERKAGELDEKRAQRMSSIIEGISLHQGRMMLLAGRQPNTTSDMVKPGELSSTCSPSSPSAELHHQASARWSQAAKQVKRRISGGTEDLDASNKLLSSRGLNTGRAGKGLPAGVGGAGLRETVAAVAAASPNNPSPALDFSLSTSQFRARSSAALSSTKINTMPSSTSVKRQYSTRGAAQGLQPEQNLLCPADIFNYVAFGQGSLRPDSPEVQVATVLSGDGAQHVEEAQERQLQTERASRGFSTAGPGNQHALDLVRQRFGEENYAWPPRGSSSVVLGGHQQHGQQVNNIPTPPAPKEVDEIKSQLGTGTTTNVVRKNTIMAAPPAAPSTSRFSDRIHEVLARNRELLPTKILVEQHDNDKKYDQTAKENNDNNLPEDSKNPSSTDFYTTMPSAPVKTFFPSLAPAIPSTLHIHLNEQNQVTAGSTTSRRTSPRSSRASPVHLTSFRDGASPPSHAVQIQTVHDRTGDHVTVSVPIKTGHTARPLVNTSRQSPIPASPISRPRATFLTVDDPTGKIPQLMPCHSSPRPLRAGSRSSSLERIRHGNKPVVTSVFGADGAMVTYGKPALLQPTLRSPSMRAGASAASSAAKKSTSRWSTTSPGARSGRGSAGASSPALFSHQSFVGQDEATVLQQRAAKRKRQEELRASKKFTNIFYGSESLFHGADLSVRSPTQLEYQKRLEEEEKKDETSSRNTFTLTKQVGEQEEEEDLAANGTTANNEKNHDIFFAHPEIETFAQKTPGSAAGANEAKTESSRRTTSVAAEVSRIEQILASSPAATSTLPSVDEKLKQEDITTGKIPATKNSFPPAEQSSSIKPDGAVELQQEKNEGGMTPEINKAGDDFHLQLGQNLDNVSARTKKRFSVGAAGSVTVVPTSVVEKTSTGDHLDLELLREDDAEAGGSSTLETEVEDETRTGAAAPPLSTSAASSAKVERQQHLHHIVQHDGASRLYFYQEQKTSSGTEDQVELHDEDDGNRGQREEPTAVVLENIMSGKKAEISTFATADPQQEHNPLPSNSSTDKHTSRSEAHFVARIKKKVAKTRPDVPEESVEVETGHHDSFAFVYGLDPATNQREMLFVAPRIKKGASTSG